MPDRLLANEVDAEDFIHGTCVLGTGGGGKLDYGRRFLLPLFGSSLSVGWRDVERIGDGDNVACVWYMGSIAPVGKGQGVDGLTDKRIRHPLVEAVKMLARFTGARIDAIVAFEMGASNAAAAVETGALLGLPVLDGDYAGRAVPEIVQVTPALHGREVCPIAVCDEWGNRAYIEETSSTAVAEAIGKMISCVTKSADSTALCGHCGMLLKGEDVKGLLVRGTLTRSLELGRVLRAAREGGLDPTIEAARALGAFVLISGVVEHMNWQSSEGYMTGETMIRGGGSWAGRAGRIWYKNENHMVWVNGRLVCSSPDLICVLYQGTGLPTNNATLKEGEMVTVLGVPNPAFRDPVSLKQFAPAHYGFDEPYVPVETLANA